SLKQKKRTLTQTVFTLATESTLVVSILATRGETEIEDVLILDDNERRTSPSSH
ncbi:9411_t:CDS:1, partial [Diversispora eburnea]